jgi:hypothetical protein
MSTDIAEGEKEVVNKGYNVTRNCRWKLIEVPTNTIFANDVLGLTLLNYEICCKIF